MDKRERNSPWKIAWEERLSKELKEKPWEIELNKSLTKAIIKQCEGKRNLLTLTGGMDTRALLSIFLKNNTPVDCFTYYNHKTSQGKVEKRTPQKITKKHGLCWILREGESNWVSQIPDLRAQYDNVISGLCMSEYLSPLEYLHFSINKIHFYQKAKASEGKELGIFLPVLDKKVIAIVKTIPIKHLLFSSTNKQIILQNKPELLKYPGTSYNFKRRIIKRLYRVWIC